MGAYLLPFSVPAPEVTPHADRAAPRQGRDESCHRHLHPETTGRAGLPGAPCAPRAVAGLQQGLRGLDGGRCAIAAGQLT